MKDRGLIVKHDYKKDDSAPVALQKFKPFRCMKKGVGKKTVMGKVKMMKKFENIGSFDVRRKGKMRFGVS